MSTDVAGRGIPIPQSNPTSLKTSIMMVPTVPLASPKIFPKITAKPFLTSSASKKSTSRRSSNARTSPRNSLLSLNNN